MGMAPVMVRVPPPSLPPTPPRCFGELCVNARGCNRVSLVLGGKGHGQVGRERFGNSRCDQGGEMVMGAESLQNPSDETNNAGAEIS